MTDVAFVLGTRPEIIKLAPVVQACQRSGIEFTIIHTGQHYSDTLDSVFFDQLELPAPDYNLRVGSSSHGEQTGEMLIAIERVLTEIDPDVVLVQGDTNSVLAGAIVASKARAELGHVEAGLRSSDRSMPEEINRIVADHVSDYLFAPTEQSESYLLDEGIPAHRITVTGNTVVDALVRNREIAHRKSTALADLGLVDTDFFLMTAHRQENVDDEKRFRDILAGVERTAKTHGVEVIYPVHPRARERIEAFGIDVPDPIRTIEPLGYLDFLRLSVAADLILTDSGGVQEEACILGVPCVTMRDNTERPETTDVGANQLSSSDPNRIVITATEMLLRDGEWENPFGDGDAAERILQALPLDAEVREVAR
ncbi:non-hydrolyzing UDP-N-acetylglucosamine 2-epimerase [Halobellus marinus]|uniref:non-hydrolyzing UDP-N-acetylglucosamine 2-epimerase n=1 Tax=Halobellus TaxID=1073986 RepID=UPI0028AF9431|nr:UDP-N-acetylglucosamine 2-epimerase (non-hydrolyzing) [Halobellus sp. DFY28]